MKIKSFYALVSLIFYLFLISCEAQKLPSGFVYLEKVIPSIQLEMRYAGTHNFIGKPIEGYQISTCIISVEAARALAKVQSELNKKNLSLKIYDAYRPQMAVDHFVAWSKNTTDTLKKSEFYPNVHKSNLFKEGYIATRSGHTRGSTVDLTIVDLSDNNKELDMGSPYDYFGIKSWVAYANLTDIQKNNRALLQEIMLKNNFRNYPKEWWHFTLRNEPFPETYFNFSIE